MSKATATTTYTWGVGVMEVAPSEDGLTDVVKMIHWTYAATDGEYSASCYGSLGVGAPEPEAFTPYADLTQEQVTEWLESGLNGEQLRAGMDRQIADLKNPPIIKPPLPWA